MSTGTDGQPDAIANPNAGFEGVNADADASELESLRREFTRTPRPYLLSHDGLEEKQGHEQQQEYDEQGPRQRVEGSSSEDESKPVSESGTEADDENERPNNFVKALPPASVRPRKGLKTGEETEDVLLTPSQLDEREKKVQGYFDEVEEEQRKEREEVQRRRYGEFARRTSEVALMGLILAIVLCGQGVASTAWEWKWELLTHFATIAMLVVVYPIKLSIVDTQATHNRISERFRVPASFDPATVLYPPLLPVLVALSVAPANPAVILPNIILGLASLPQRLFPRSSRLGRINAVHWLVSVLPLIVSENTAWPSKTNPGTPYLLKAPQGLSPETLVSLYPLHHALMVPLHYLTTTSLLVSELHLLSVALINLLLLASSPQATILKSCLWIGGVSLFVACGPVLHWNITLARIPRWKLRRPGHTAEERKSLVDAVSDLINLQRAAGAFTSATGLDSDADEDMPRKSIKHKPARSANGMPKLNTAGLVMPSLSLKGLQPQSALESSRHTKYNASTEANPLSPRKRRNTVPERYPPSISEDSKPSRHGSNKRKAKPSSLLWCLQLTPEQATRRKWLYAGFTYLAIVAIIMAPVRLYVLRKALFDQEPIGWAVGYLFGQIPWLRSIVEYLDISAWIPLPPPSADWRSLSLALPPHVNDLRHELGQSNVRLLLIGYWIGVLIIGLLAVFSLTAFVEVDTRRKVFHGVMVAMFVPTVYVDPCYCALALSLVLAIFLLLEVIRAGQVPPLGNAIGRFVAPYVDGRDLRGPVVVSHIFLLIGCAVPLWFSLASILREGDLPWKEWELAQNSRETAMIAGVVCVGMGDAAASLIGRRYGRHKWIWIGGKSIEGSAAFAAAVTVGLMAGKAWQAFGHWNHEYGNGHGSGDLDRTALVLAWEWSFAVLKAALCACGASFMEAVLTGANDNVVVPVALWLLVRGVRL